MDLGLLSSVRTAGADAHSTESGRVIRSRGDRFYARWTTTRYDDGERYTSCALVVGRWKRTLRFHKSRNA